MIYSKKDFDEISSKLKQNLCSDEDKPLPCRLLEFEMPDDYPFIKKADEDDHVADACNLAASIQGINCLLNLTKDDHDCDRLSRILVRELSCLREAVQNAEEQQIEYEKTVLNRTGISGFNAKPAEKNIRLWADALKHPAATIVAHQCFEDKEEADLIVDTSKLRELEKQMGEICRSDPSENMNASKAWRKVWDEYSGKTVQFSLPTVDEIKAFLDATTGRLENLINRRKKIAKQED